jgi:hypothetical protein
VRLFELNNECIQALCDKIDPLKQFQMLRELTQPALFGTKQQKNEKKTSIKHALIAASNLIQSESNTGEK